VTRAEGRGLRAEGRAAPRVLFVVNAEWYFISHRLPLARALRDAGCEVIVAAAVEKGMDGVIRSEGLQFIPLRLERGSTHAWREAGTVLELYRLYRRVRPDVVHHVAIKPVLYGSFAARLARVPAVINAVPGLGYTFLRRGWKGWLTQRLVQSAYRFAFSGRSTFVIFQNPDDKQLWESRGVGAGERTVLIRGSGVDTREFAATPDRADPPVVMLASRLLWDKGVQEFVDAARSLRGEGLHARFVLVGSPDEQSPSSVPAARLQAWVEEGAVEWWGHRSDMPQVLAAASVVVLPSYREGVPKVLIEAASSARAIIATDVPGCREVVTEGDNGLLVPARRSEELAAAIRRLVADRTLRDRMGARGREVALRDFSIEQVVEATLNLYRRVLGGRWPS
jgi:glycosyltransferase involved in cell wall biosynthesis